MIYRAVGVVGVGTTGQGIAITCAAAGLDVLVHDRTPAGTAAAIAQVGETLDRDIAKWRRTASEKKAILARVKPVDDMGALEAAQIVVEAIPEDLDRKVAIFQELDRICPPEDILATNTSALSVTEIAARTKRPDRVIGLHFLPPVPTVPLVELVRGLATSDATFADSVAFIKLLGKTGVEVYEYPGYVTTRVILPFLNEAMYVVMEGVASAHAVDTAMRLGYGHPMGPLELTDLVGLDVRLAIADYLERELGPSFHPPDLLRARVADGKLGKKSGEGFYRWEAGKPVK